MPLRRAIASLAATALLGAGAFAAAGCGAEDAVGVDVAKAAEATAEKGTARLRLKMVMSGAGLPGSLTINGRGVTALDQSKAAMTFDLAPVLRLAGVPGKGAVDVRFGDGALHVKVPAIPGVEVPGGKRWISVDLRAAARAMGVDPEGAAALLAMDPAAQLRALKAAKGMKEVGKEQVAGAETTHMRGTFRISDFIAGLPAAKRAKARKALEQLEEVGGEPTGIDDPTPADLWVDEDGVMRRMRSTVKVPAQGGAPAGTFSMDYELSGFGAELDASAPPASQTYDATELLSQLLEAGMAAGRAPTQKG